MKVYNILVEGMDDLVFVRRLIEVMRNERSLEHLKWEFCSGARTLTLDKRKFGSAWTMAGNGDVVAVMETSGVYLPVDLDKLVPSVKRIKAEDGDADWSVDALACIFDADAPKTDFGREVNYGGFAARSLYVPKRLSSWGVSKKYFYFPDNASDGSLEDLAKTMIKEPYRFAIEREWPNYRSSLKAKSLSANLPYYPSSSKCDLSQFAAAYDLSVAKDQYWISSLWNDNIWDWNVSNVSQLKDFILGAVPSLFK